MKKFLSLLLVVVMAFSLAACSQTAEQENGDDVNSTDGITVENIKAGFIYIGDENEGYTAAHYAGALEMKEALGLTDDQLIFKWLVPEGEAAYDAAVDLAEQGCNIIFANSFGHESYILQAAEEYPEVEFCHATGYQAQTSGLSNMHNYFTAVYESRYVAGVVAGMKLAEMIADGTITEAEAVMGYVGAFPFAEVVSGYTAFYLGAKSVCPSVTMNVRYTNSWSSFDLEKEAAEALIADGCVLISQHADTTGAPVACEANQVPVVGYNISMLEAAPNYALTSASISWGPYVTYAVESVLNGTAIDTDWCQGYAEGANSITELNDAYVAEGTVEKVAEVEAAIIDGSLHVFDINTFSVGGASLVSESGEVLEEYAEYVFDGYYHESYFASAPSFELRIDGITEK